MHAVKGDVTFDLSSSPGSRDDRVEVGQKSAGPAVNSKPERVCREREKHLTCPFF